MARSLDEIADDIRDATKTYEYWVGVNTRLRMELDETAAPLRAASDFIDQYRDELLEAVNR